MKVIVCLFSILSLHFGLCIFIKQLNINGVRNGTVLSMIKTRRGYEHINILFSEELITFNYFHQITSIFFSQFNLRHKYHLLPNNLYLDCTQQRLIDCDVKSINENKIIKLHIDKDYSKHISIIDNTLIIKGFDDGGFVLLWCTKQPSINYQFYDSKITQMSSVKSIFIKSFTQKRPYLSIDTFPNNNYFILAYSHNSINTISIYNRNNTLIQTLSSFIKASPAVSVKVLNDEQFIACQLFNQPKNNCKIGTINNDTYINLFSITISSNIYSISSLGFDKFVIIGSNKNREIRADVFNLRGELLYEASPIIIPKTKQTKITKIDSEIVNNDILTIIIQIKKGNKASYFYQLFDLELMCFDNRLTVDALSFIKINFEDYIVFNNHFYLQKHSLLVRVLDLPSQGVLKVKQSNEEVMLGRQYLLDQIEYYASVSPINTNLSGNIIVKYIILINYHKETEICSLIIHINDKTNRVNVKEDINLKQSIPAQQLISKSSLYEVMIILILVIQFYSTIKETIHHKQYCPNKSNSSHGVIKYYTKKMFQENMTNDLNYIQILLHLIKNYNSFNFSFSYHYSCKDKSMYLISKIILLFGFVALELKGNYKVSGLVLFEKLLFSNISLCICVLIANCIINRLLYLYSKELPDIDIDQIQLKLLSQYYSLRTKQYNPLKNYYPSAKSSNSSDAPSVLFSSQSKSTKPQLKERDISSVYCYCFVSCLFWIISFIYYSIPYYLYCDNDWLIKLFILNAISVFIFSEAIALFLSSVFINYIHSSDYCIERGFISFLTTIFNPTFVVTDFLIYGKLNTEIDNLNM